MNSKLCLGGSDICKILTNCLEYLCCKYWCWIIKNQNLIASCSLVFDYLNQHLIFSDIFYQKIIISIQLKKNCFNFFLNLKMRNWNLLSKKKYAMFFLSRKRQQTKELSWECPGHILDMAKCPQTTQTACPVGTYKYQFDGAFVHVAPSTSTIIQKIVQFFTF